MAAWLATGANEMWGEACVMSTGFAPHFVWLRRKRKVVNCCDVRRVAHYVASLYGNRAG